MSVFVSSYSVMYDTIFVSIVTAGRLSPQEFQGGGGGHYTWWALQMSFRGILFWGRS